MVSGKNEEIQQWILITPMRTSDSLISGMTEASAGSARWPWLKQITNEGFPGR
jgi:hypothetical protein